MTEAEDRALVGHRFPDQVEAGKTAHRAGFIQRLFRTRVRHVEPVLEEVDAQHPLQSDSAGDRCRPWDNRARSVHTADPTEPPGSARPEIVPGVWACDSVQNPRRRRFAVSSIPVRRKQCAY